MDRLTASELASRLDAQNSTFNINLTQILTKGAQKVEKLEEKNKTIVSKNKVVVVLENFKYVDPITAGQRDCGDNAWTSAASPQPVFSGRS